MKTLREYINIVDNGLTPSITEAVAIDPLAIEYSNAINQIAQNRATAATEMSTSKDPEDQYTAKAMMRDAKNWTQVAKAFSRGMQVGAEKFFELDDYDDLWEFLEDHGHDVRNDILPLR